MCDGRWCKSNLPMASIKSGVIPAYKDVSQDPKLGIHQGKSGKTYSGAIVIGHTHYIICGLQSESLPSNDEHNFGQFVDLRTVEQVLIVRCGQTAKQAVNYQVFPGRSCQKRSTCICDRLAILADNCASHFQAIQSELPVTRMSKRYVDKKKIHTHPPNADRTCSRTKERFYVRLSLGNPVPQSRRSWCLQKWSRVRAWPCQRFDSAPPTGQ